MLFEPGWMGWEDGPGPSWKTNFRLKVPHSVGADRIRPLPCTGPACSLTAFPMSPKTESPLSVDSGLPYKIRHRPTLPPVTAIPSALAGLTSLFGMGRGGHRRYRHLNTFLYMPLGNRTLTCYWKKRSEKERGQQVYPHWKASGY